MQNLPVIAGVEINTDTEGRFNLNALHKASGKRGVTTFAPDSQKHFVCCGHTVCLFLNGTKPKYPLARF